MDMNNKLEILSNVIGDEFVQIDAQNFKSRRGDALVLNKDEITDYVKEGVKQEIPYLSNELLKKYLPEKFNNDFILDEYKELSKFATEENPDLLSGLIEDFRMFAWDVVENFIPIEDLVFIDSKVTCQNNHWIFYKLNEN